MSFPYRRDQIALYIGDLAAFAIALWLALFIRHFTLPSLDELVLHAPFAILFLCWILVFVAVGLYDKHVALFERRLAETVTEAQTINLILALAFFFVAPVGIQPKTILALYFVISTALIVVWRLGAFHYVVSQRMCEPVVFVGEGIDMEILTEEVRQTPQSRFSCARFIPSAGVTEDNLRKQVHEAVVSTGSTAVVSGVRFPLGVSVPVVDAAFVYESLFDRVPLTLTEESSFSLYRYAVHAVYDVAKRAVDILLSSLLLVVLLILMPFVYAALRFEGKGPLFITQKRIGRGWSDITVLKFRTMTENEQGSAAWVGESKNRVTKVGAFLRKTSIDELPQIIAVFTGSLSLIGPRSDIVGLGERLREALPLYALRYTVTPGISGWAQVNQKYAPGNISPQSIEESRVRLEYDLYYVKYRSLLLDLSITLKTIRTLVARVIP